MASLVLWPPKLPDYRRDKRPTAGRTSVCVCAQNHWCKLTHPAWAQMATSPSSHSTVEELSPQESWSSTLPPKPTTPSLPVVYNALHSPSIFLDLWLIVYHFHVFFSAFFIFWNLTSWVLFQPSTFLGRLWVYILCMYRCHSCNYFRRLRRRSSNNAHRSKKDGAVILLCTSVVTLKILLVERSQLRRASAHAVAICTMVTLPWTRDRTTWMELRVNTAKHLSRSREVTRLTSKAKR